MMRPHDGRIDHLHAARWALALVQGPQHQFPDASQRPAPELPVHRRPLAEILVQITPGSTRARDPEHAVQHPSVILRWPTALPASRDHEWLEKRPLRVRHQTANQNCLPKSSLESHRRSVVNPLCQQDLDWPSKVTISLKCNRDGCNHIWAKPAGKSGTLAGR